MFEVIVMEDGHSDSANCGSLSVAISILIVLVTKFRNISSQ